MECTFPDGEKKMRLYKIRVLLKITQLVRSGARSLN